MTKVKLNTMKIAPPSDDAPKVGRPKVDRPELILHPLFASDPDVKVETVPDDFDPKKHKPLKKKNFTEEHFFFTFRADAFRRLATRFDVKSKESKLLGATGNQVKARRLVKMQAKIKELQEQLQSQGVDTDALMANVIS